MCQRQKCLACGQPDGEPTAGCAHSRLERHEPSVDGSFADDARRARSPTKPIQPMTGAIDVDLADAEAAAEFLEMVARVIREKKRIRVMIE
jgi:hypothetical protein